MYLKDADQLSHKVLNHLTRKVPKLSTSITLQAALFGYLESLMKFCAMYLDDNTESLLTRVADHCDIERNKVESILTDVIAKELVNREQGSVQAE